MLFPKLMASSNLNKAKGMAALAAGRKSRRSSTKVNVADG